MQYLLDTCILIWVLEDNAKALSKLLPILTNLKHVFLVSVASYWEIIIKQTRGKLQIKGDIVQTAEKSGLSWLDIKYTHAEQVQHLPRLHNDPFDRMIIAQSLVEKCKLLTTDKQILQYDLKSKH